MSRLFVLAVFVWYLTATGYAATGTSVSWSIGKASSTVDGVANSGPVTFTWTFDREVTYGTYADGTPWVIWEDGLKLTAVSPNKKTEDLPKETGSGVLAGGVTDATCINLKEDRLPLDQRMEAKWDAADVWDGTPALLAVGDCIVTGRGRRDARSAFRKMIFTAVGACNVVARDMTGHYRPPIRMPGYLRAGLATPQQADVTSFDRFDIPDPKNWAGSTVNLDLAGTTDADNLLNGPITNCGIYSHTWYEPCNAMLNHDLGGTADGAYQRDVARRFAACLYTAFDPDVATDKRQRSLDRFIQVGLDYFYQSCLGYGVWNGGGGHPNGLEGVITLTGALLQDSVITNAVKFQRFPGAAVGRGDTVVDMLSGGSGTYARTEACYLVAPAAWRSGDFNLRTIGAGAGDLTDAVMRFDFARDDHVVNNNDVPYTALVTVDSFTAVTIDAGFTWPMWTRNAGSAKNRSYRYLDAGVARLTGDTRIRKIMGFKQTITVGWTETTWGAAGNGGILFIYPALTAAELTAIGQSGTITTGICSRQEAENDEVVIWDSWSVDNVGRIQTAFFVSPSNPYLGIKLYDNYQWLPYYHLLDDPGAPGKKMYQESPGYMLLTRFMKMQRDFGRFFWDGILQDSNVPKSATIQALTRYYLYGDQMPAQYCKTYDLTDQMWNEVVGIADDRGGRTFRLTVDSKQLTGKPLYSIGGNLIDPHSAPSGIYLVKDGESIIKNIITR